MDVIPIAAGFAGFAPGEDGAVRGHDEAGDVVELVSGFGDFEEVLFVEEGFGGRGTEHPASQEQATGCANG